MSKALAADCAEFELNGVLGGETKPVAEHPGRLQLEAPTQHEAASSFDDPREIRPRQPTPQN